MDRARFVALTLAAPLLGARPDRTPGFAELEKRSGGRLGVYAMTLGGPVLAHRADERFPMCSTFKTLLAAAVLVRVDRGNESLERSVPFSRSDLLSYAPVTAERVAAGHMRVDDLLAAAIEESDNTAANLLLGATGGPSVVTRLARALGDSQTRLDRTEPTLNTSIPGDPRDTTTPESMARDVGELVFGTFALSPASRARLDGWLRRCRTGDTRLRAGLPRAWTVGDKTGSGERGTSNDVAVCHRPGASPVVIAAYLTGSTLAEDGRDEILAGVGRLAATTFA